MKQAPNILKVVARLNQMGFTLVEKTPQNRCGKTIQQTLLFIEPIMSSKSAKSSFTR